MAREWCAVYGPALVTRTKYRRLSPAARGALLHVWALAGLQDPEAAWPSYAALLEALELDGFDSHQLDELVRHAWLDTDPDGRVWVHDWDDHQLAASEDVRRAWQAIRKRDWRRRKGTTSTITASSTGQDITGVPDPVGHVPDGPGHVPDDGRTFAERMDELGVSRELIAGGSHGPD